MNQIPKVNLKKTGTNIYRLRQEAGISVRELQLILGLGSAQAIYKWQNGESLPTVDNLVILAAVLGVSIEQIIICDSA